VIPYGEPTAIGLRQVARITGVPSKAIQRAVRHERLQTPELPELLTARQSGWLLCVSCQEISSLIRRGVLEAVREEIPDGWRWRIRTADVLAIGRSLEQTEAARR
jgi:hypothetical protein